MNRRELTDEEKKAIELIYKGEPVAGEEAVERAINLLLGVSGLEYLRQLREKNETTRFP